MTDFHTHILPGMDDGCKSPEESAEALVMLKSSGVSKVMLTPHYYANKESVEEFLVRRRNSFDVLKDYLEENAMLKSLDIPELCLGAEVKFFYGISRHTDIKELCYEDTSCMLIEMPFEKWDAHVYSEVGDLQGRYAVTPLIAHFNRYLIYGNKFSDIMSLRCPIQLNAEVFEKRFIKRKWLKYIKKENVVLGSDTHNTNTRKPNMDKALFVISHKLGDEFMCKIDNIGKMLINT